jgi:hypothetical protein
VVKAGVKQGGGHVSFKGPYGELPKGDDGSYGAAFCCDIVTATSMWRSEQLSRIIYGHVVLCPEVLLRLPHLLLPGWRRAGPANESGHLY